MKEKMTFHSVIKRKLNLHDADAINSLSSLLENFQQDIGNEDKGEIAYIMERLYSKHEHDVSHPIIGLSIAPQDLDFTFAHPVYSATPRLLLQVPSPNPGEDIINIEAMNWPKDKEKLGYQDAPLRRNSVIIYPNIEGNEPDVKDRPVVHWSGAIPGEFIIIGGVTFSDQEKIWNIIENEIGKPAQDTSIWEHYKQNITLTNLGNIITQLQGEGFSNQYCTTSKYINEGEASPATDDSDVDAGGFFVRDQDKERCACIFISGTTRLGYQPSEELKDGGFAVLVEDKHGKSFVRPVSTNFMQKNYRYQSNDAPVLPPKKLNDLSFIQMHPLYKQEREFVKLLIEVEKINNHLRNTY